MEIDKTKLFVSIFGTYFNNNSLIIIWSDFELWFPEFLNFSHFLNFRFYFHILSFKSLIRPDCGVFTLRLRKTCLKISPCRSSFGLAKNSKILRIQKPLIVFTKAVHLKIRYYVYTKIQLAKLKICTILSCSETQKLYNEDDKGLW